MQGRAWDNVSATSNGSRVGNPVIGLRNQQPVSSPARSPYEREAKSMSVTNLHANEPPALLIGPFEAYRVVIDDRVIPRLTGRKMGDRVELVVDGRFGATFREEDAHQVAWLIAQAMAIGAGYPSLNAESKDQPFASICREITT